MAHIEMAIYSIGQTGGEVREMPASLAAAFDVIDGGAGVLRDAPAESAAAWAASKGIPAFTLNPDLNAETYDDVNNVFTCTTEEEAYKALMEYPDFMKPADCWTLMANDVRPVPEGKAPKDWAYAGRHYEFKPTVTLPFRWGKKLKQAALDRFQNANLTVHWIEGGAYICAPFRVAGGFQLVDNNDAGNKVMVHVSPDKRVTTVVYRSRHAEKPLPFPFSGGLSLLHAVTEVLCDADMA